MLAAAVPMRDPMGGRPIDLRPTLDVWLEIEEAHGALGSLWMATKAGHVRLALHIDILHRCARAAGSTLEWRAIGERVHRVGLFATTDLLLRLFSDVFVPTEDEVADPKAKEPPVPLSSGG